MDMRWLVVAAVAVSAIPAIVTWAMRGPGSLYDQFRREVELRTRAVSSSAPTGVVTDTDLERLPHLLRHYLQAAGVVGRPRPRAYRLAFTGRIRGGPDEPWMRFEAEQFSSVDEPVRLFYMRARRSGVPVAVLHRYVAGSATMTVRLAGLVPVADAQGPVMDRSETVTVFNDMCLLAPGTLLDPHIAWRDTGSTVEGIFTAAGHTVSATLTFDDRALLTNFTSHDRSRASADGRSFTRLPFLTPVSRHVTFDRVVMAGAAEAQWRMPDGQLFTYAEFILESAEFLPRAQ
jgi:hypothetical protein